MARTVFCAKLQKDLPGLDEAPWPGELGKRIYDNVSAQAWKMWEDRMKMILNEYRLMPWQKEAQQLMAKQMEDFFFGGTDVLPPEYKPKIVVGGWWLAASQITFHIATNHPTTNHPTQRQAYTEPVVRLTDRSCAVPIELIPQTQSPHSAYNSGGGAGGRGEAGW